MKKMILILTCLVILLAMIFSSCGKEPVKQPTISDPNGKIIEETIIKETIIKETTFEDATTWDDIK